MDESIPVGIDVNGLQDVAAFGIDTDAIVGGTIPSVVIALQDTDGFWEITAGAEATRAFAGRGFDWPKPLNVDGEGIEPVRIPLVDIIGEILDNSDPGATGSTAAPEEMLIASIQALVRARENIVGEPNVVIAIPDDGRFDEDIQQRILNAARIAGLNVQLLWRSVAAVLGMADDLQSSHAQLKGREIAVITCLNEGISVNRLEIMVEDDPESGLYIVPKRNNAGRFFAFPISISEFAINVGKIIAEEIDVEPEHIVWGDGLPLRWILNQADRDGYFQAHSNWCKYPGQRPSWLEDITLPEGVLDDIHDFIADIDYTIIEGPALTISTSRDAALMWSVRDALKARRETRFTLAFKGLDTYLAPVGCVEYGNRQLSNKITYYDHLPQLKLAVRRNEKAEFVQLVSAGALCEGGKEFNELIDLNVNIPQGARLIDFFLFREGAPAPRHAALELKFAVTSDTPIRMRVQQTPAQGQARLTIESASANTQMARLVVNWDRMTILWEKSEDDIVAELERAPQAAVPPIQPHPCHPFLWTFKSRRNDLFNFSLAERTLRLSEEMDPSQELPLKELVEVRKLLTRFQSPSILSRRWGPDQHRDRFKARAVSSDGELPKLGDGLTEDVFRAFDDVLETVALRLHADGVTTKERNQIVTFSTWAFSRCPQIIRDELRSAASELAVVSAMNDFGAMGRSFDRLEELQALYTLIHKFASDRGRLLDYHARALFYTLSLREKAPEALTAEQAEDFVKLSIPAIETMMTSGRYSRLMTICIKTIGGLIRYRLVEPAFLDTSEYWGSEVKKLLKLIVRRTEGNPRRESVYQLSHQVIDVLDRQGVVDSILQWPGDDEEGEENDDQ
jgi:hypothetical protein